MNTERQREQISFHEAGHAVLRHCLKLPVVSVEVTENGGRCTAPNECLFELSDAGIKKLVRQEAVFRLIVAGCGGRAVMDRFYGYKAKSDANWKASSDYKNSFRLALEITGGDREGAELLVA